VPVPVGKLSGLTIEEGDEDAEVRRSHPLDSLSLVLRRPT
jgi:hypothetical protein